MGICKRFYPDYMYVSVQDIEGDFFKKRNIKYALIDIDNTLVPYTVPLPTEESRKFLARLEEEGVSYCFLSNNNRERAEMFAEALGAKYVSDAKKPMLTGLKKAMKILGADSRHTIVIGDQIFTDVLTGRRAKMMTMLVRPIEDKETAFFKFKRAMEGVVLRNYKKGT